MPPSQALALHTVKRVSLVLDIPGPVVSARLVSRGERGRVVEVLSLVVEVLALHNAWRVSLVHLIVRLVVIPGAGRRDRIQ